ncbi:MAG: DUF3488 domain-containing protein [Deltaproteobacteria bacterium]|nr:DUF3488 domain-containing protein [Deltaproteobacteria bacterium]
MNFSTYFTIISYLMAGTGLAASALTAAVSPFALFTAVLVLGIGLFLNLKAQFLNIPKFLWNAFALSLFAFFAIDYFFISNLLLDSASRFLTIIMAAKLFDLKTNRDYLTLYILAFFQLLAASAATTNLTFLFVFILYIIVGIWTLVIFNLKKDWEEKAQGQTMPRAILGPKFFIATLGLAIFSLIITFALFFIIPRIGTGFFQKKPSPPMKVTGFSGKVDLGELGAVKMDERVVMRVGLPELDNPPQFPIYFRGIALDNYDGISWKQTIKQSSFIARNTAGVFALKNTSGAEDILKQEILLEPIETDVLFAASFGTALSGPLPTRLRVDSMDSIYLLRPPLARIEYTAYSAVTKEGQGVKESKGQRVKESESQRVKEIYLQIPDGVEAAAELAKKITKGIEAPYLKTIAIQEFLQKNYKYTLNPKKNEGKTPLDDFLFYSKEGYCEHYATAMAIMLRTVNVPTRLVTGFLQGEWNRFGNYLLVRQRDAHSWVEAYLPTEKSKGDWFTFDPTPSAETVGEMPLPMSALNLYLDSIRWRWNRYIVHYTFLDQLAAARNIDTRFSYFFYNIKNSFAKPKEYKWKEIKGGQGIIISGAILLFLFLFIFLRRSQAKKKAGQFKNTPAFYIEMLKILHRKGIKKTIGKTPLEFAMELNRKEVEVLTELYLKIRYGRYMPNDYEITNAKKSLAYLKKAL